MLESSLSVEILSFSQLHDFMFYCKVYRQSIHGYCKSDEEKAGSTGGVE